MSHLLDSIGVPYSLYVPSNLLRAVAKGVNLETLIGTAIRLLLIGAIVAMIRRAYSWSAQNLDRILFPTAYVAVHDTSYLWIMAYLAQNPHAQAQIRDFQLSTAESKDARGSSNSLKLLAILAGTQANGNVASSSQTVGGHNSTWTSKEVIGQVLPTYHQPIRLCLGGNYLWVTRKMGHFARTQLRTVDHIQIRAPFWQKNALKEFLVTAHQLYFAKEEKELLIFHPLRINPRWQVPVSRPARPWSSVFLPGTVKEDLLADVEKFLSEDEASWYAARGIPHRRGYLLHGVPGSGKTTLATAIASKLRLDIYVINPSQRGMDDAKLNKLFRDCPARSIILIEDIDCIFPSNHGRATLQVEEATSVIETGSQAAKAEPVESTGPAYVGGSHDLAPSTVTLSGLLNAIDGVSSQEGCVLIASTNHPEYLDPALKRAGRFDVQIEFRNATPAQTLDLFKHFYEVSRPVSISASTDIDEKQPLIVDAKRPIKSEDELDSLAQDFVSSIFPGERAEDGAETQKKGISMATLQGYLLPFKDDAFAAVQQAGEWARTLETAPAVRRIVVNVKPATRVVKKKSAKPTEVEEEK